MVRVLFDTRILCDSSFMNWALKQTARTNIIKQLMRIKSNSKDFKGEHNHILDFDFKELTKEKVTEGHFIRAAVKEVTLPHFLDGISEDFITKRIRYAIWLANKPPCNTHILTSPEKKCEYENNQHLKGMSSVTVCAGNEALAAIDRLWRLFVYKRELSR